MTQTVKTCAAEGCDRPLNKGRKYCSRSCANRAKAGLAAKSKPMPVLQMVRQGHIPKSMEVALQAEMGTNEANLVLREIQDSIAVKAAEPPKGAKRSSLKPPTKAQIDIDAQIDYFSQFGGQYLSDVRRDTAIGYEDIELMQRCGIMVFSSRMKKSSIITSLSNPRYWDVKSPNKDLEVVTKTNLLNVFQRHASDILLSLDYGSVFMAKEWAMKTAEEIGIDEEEENIKPDSKWWVVDKLHSVHPTKVTEVLRNPKSLEFEGFTHERSHIKPEHIKVKSPQALVINYNSMFGNIWGQSMFEPVFDYWFWYEVTMRAFMRFLERMGTPVAVGKAPSRGTVQRPDGSVVNNAEWAMLVAGMAGTSSAVFLPSDVDPTSGQPLWGLEYLTAQSEGKGFIDALQLLSTWILRGMIIGDRAATQDSQTGSYAAAVVHSGQTELDNDLIYKSVVGQLNRWLLPDYGKYNVSPNNPPPVLLQTEGLDPREKDRIMKLVATAGNQKLGGGSPFDWLDWQTMFNAVDLPTLDDDKRKELMEEMTEEALDKQEKFNELQSKMDTAAGSNPMSAKEQKKGTPPTGKKPSSIEKEETARQKLFEYLEEGGMVPIVLSNDEALEIIGLSDKGE